MRFAEIPVGDEWQVGNIYRLTFDVRPNHFLGVDLPILNKRANVESAIQALRDKPQLEVIDWVYANDRLQVTVRAVQPASPVHVIVGLILGIFLLFSLKLILDSAAVLTDEIGQAIDETNVKFKVGETEFEFPIVITAIGLVASFAAFVFIRRSS